MALDDSAATRSSLLAVLQRRPAALGVIRGDGPPLIPVAVSPDERLLAIGDEDGFVTFETTAQFADADYVSVWANWGPGGSWVRVEAAKVGDRWRATVGPLDPWSYYYRLIVDRVPVKDASNPTSVTSEPAWSTFFIPGEESRLLADIVAKL